MRPPDVQRPPDGEPAGERITDLAGRHTETTAPVRQPRVRRNKAAMETLRSAIYLLAEENQPCTVRQIYYLGIGRYWQKDTGPSRKTYNRVCSLVGELREAEVIPWGWIADNTRWFRKQTMFNSPEHILQSVASTYRRDIWARQPIHVEVWCESDSIAGVLDDVTYPMGVALFPCRGQSSKTTIYQAAQSYAVLGKPIVILYVGDWDPSGLAIPFSVEDRMGRYGDVAVELIRVAVTPEDVASGDLISHSVNIRDPNYQRFVDRCRLMELAPQTAVEVEAIPPEQLRQRLRDAIEVYVNPVQWNATLAAERSERELFKRMVRGDVSAYHQLVRS